MLTPNHLRILHHIHDQPEVTRAVLSEQTQFSQATVLRLVSDLRDKGYVIQHRAREEQNGPGRPSMTLRVNPELGYAMGLEFGHNYLMTCIINALGELVHSQRLADVPPFEQHDRTFELLGAAARKTADDAGIPWAKIKTVGLALHGVVNAEGEWLLWTESNEPFPAQQQLTMVLQRLVFAEDVSRAFAEAEHRFGAGKHVPDMIYVFVGSHGLGAGIFVNDMLLKSTSGICGELGHVIVDPEGILCQCGNRGCLETVATHDAVVQRLRDRLQKGVISTLKDDEQLTFAQICQAANAGDKEAHIAIEELVTYLAQALAGTINIIGATLILIGGQLRLAGSSFLTDLESALRRQVLPALAQQLTVHYAVLPAYAGAWGVAAQASDLAWATNEFTHHPSIGS